MAGSNFFTASSDAANVDIALIDSAGLAMYAKCTGAPPTTANVFAAGCIMARTDAGSGNKGVYENTGTSASPSWNLVGDVAASEITLADGDILVGNGSNVAAAVTMSGAVTIDNTGSATLAPLAFGYAQVSISSADILALNSTPKELVAAPGAGNILVFERCIIDYTFDTAAYTGGGAISVQLASGPETLSPTLSAANSFQKGSDGTFYLQALSATAVDLEAEINQALELTCDTGDFTDPGTAAGTATAHVWYRTLTF